MPTGPGALDTEGIYQYGEDDERPLGSDLLNLLANSVSTQFTLTRDEIQAIRDLVTPQNYTPLAVSPTLIGSSMLVTKVGRIVHAQIHLTRPAGSPFLATQGLCWLPEPIGAKQARPIATWYGSAQLGHLILAGTGQLQTDSVIPVAGATSLFTTLTYVSAA